MHVCVCASSSSLRVSCFFSLPRFPFLTMVDRFPRIPFFHWVASSGVIHGHASCRLRLSMVDWFPRIPFFHWTASSGVVHSRAFADCVLRWSYCFLGCGTSIGVASSGVAPHVIPCPRAWLFVRFVLLRSFAFFLRVRTHTIHRLDAGGPPRRCPAMPRRPATSSGAARLLRLGQAVQGGRDMYISHGGRVNVSLTGGINEGSIDDECASCLLRPFA